MEEGIEDETETVDEATPLTKTETDPIDNEKKSRPAMMGCPPLEWDRLTMAGALSTCAAVMIGANSVVGLPYEVMQSGIYFFLGIMILTALIMAHNSHLLYEVTMVVRDKNEGGFIRNPYPIIADLAFGCFFRYLIILAMFFANFIWAVTTLILMGQILITWTAIHGIGAMDQIRVWVVTLSVIIIPLTIPASLKDNIVVSSMATILFAISVMGLFVMYIAIKIEGYIKFVPPPNPTLESVIEVVGYAFSAMGLLTYFTPNIIMDVKEHKDFKKASRSVYVYGLVIALLVTVTPYFTFGGTIQHVIFANIDTISGAPHYLRVVSVMTKAALVLQGLMATVVVLNPVFLQIEEAFGAPTELTWKRVAIRAGITLIVGVAGAALSTLQMLLTIAASALINFLSVSSPIFIYLGFFKKISMPYKIMLIAILVGSSGVSIAAVYYEIVSIVALSKTWWK